MTRRLVGSAALTLPLFTIAMAGMLEGTGFAHALATPTFALLQLGLATPVVLWGGWPFFVRGARSVVTRHWNMFTLIAGHPGTAYAYSLVATLAPGVFPTRRAATRRRRRDCRGDRDARAPVRCSSCARGRTEPRSARYAAGADACAAARRRQQATPLEQVLRGDRLRVRPGEGAGRRRRAGRRQCHRRVDAFGRRFRREPPGDRVAAGSVNGTGSFVMRAERVGAETLLAHRAARRRAQRSHAPISVSSIASRRFVPAVATVASPSQRGCLRAEPQLANALVHTVTVLIIACPCALGLTTPVVVVATGRAGGRALQGR